MTFDAPGSIFESKAQCWVSPVNCLAKSGKGLAKEFKERFPDSHRHFEEFVKLNGEEFYPGCIFIHERPKKPFWIAFLATKLHWREPSKMDYVVKGVIGLADVLPKMKCSSVAIPALGCGPGGLNWDEVKPEIQRIFKDVAETTAFLYGPQ